MTRQGPEVLKKFSVEDHREKGGPMRYGWALLVVGLLGAAPAGPEREVLQVDRARIEVVIPPGYAEPHRAEMLDWIRASAQAVSLWYGTFPVQTLRIDISAREGARVGGATTWPGGPSSPPHVSIGVGTAARTPDFDRDWVLVHELTHLAFPPVADRHHWIEEGLATYLEPWARVAAGRLSAESAWHDFVRDLPQGLPRPGERGLDQTSTWASTYWGGALYCLLADLAIRERTGNQLGLRDAVKAIARGGGMTRGGAQDLARVLAVGDAAVGGRELTATWERMRDEPVQVDLDKLWKELGVQRVGGPLPGSGTVRFDDTAPKAAIRKAIAPVP
jgi:hypothetical protein